MSPFEHQKAMRKLSASSWTEHESRHRGEGSGNVSPRTGSEVGHHEPEVGHHEPELGLRDPELGLHDPEVGSHDPGAVHHESDVGHLEAEQLTENQRIYELARANEILADSIEQLSRKLDVNPIIDFTMEKVSQLMGTSLVEYWRYDHDSGLGYAARICRDGGAESATTVGHPAADGIPLPPSLIEADRNPYRRQRAYVSSLDEQKGLPKPLRAHYRDDGERNPFVHLPLLSQERIVGGIIAIFSEHSPFSRINVEVAHALVNQCSLAIRIREAANETIDRVIPGDDDPGSTELLTKMNRERGIFSGAAMELASESRIEHFFGSMLAEAVEYLDADMAMMCMYHPAQDEHEWLVTVQSSVQRSPTVESPPSQRHTRTAKYCPAWEEVVRIGRPVRMRVSDVDPQKYPEFVQEHTELGHRSIAAAPLLSGTIPLGNLVVCSTSDVAVTQLQLGFLQTLAAQAAVAVRMADLNESAKVAAINEERNLMAREIHDTLAQNFVGVLMQMEAAEEARTIAPDRVEEFHGRVKQLAKDGILQARKAICTFGHSADDGTPLDVSVRHLLQRFCDGTRVSYNVRVVGDVGVWTPSETAQLRAILVEAIVNSVKHGSPTSIEITMLCQSPNWRLTMVDDGCGVPIQVQHDDALIGQGLRNMELRARSIGAQFTLDSVENEGTTIIIEPQK